ncbi:Lrp/AsnC family transcriptional regulator [Crocinitomix catalasitica]|uniref:Lrp/AsnC family transcriptional regulator n=1 Tax=Crocinitomix catalasitica TaxID=184607 RepID=UPI000484897E|nr:winged helix-turn-helix transcriptional regulator [Crocinitomix catalasitica]|tara:strand:+ start:49 stop:522 length:474 start_codon:yes stop_codon:yes gene_type:complete
MIRNIDKVDLQILDFLIADARMPYTEIAKNIGVSAGTVHVRVKKLEKRGLIQGASLVVNYEVMGYSFTAYVGIIIGRSSDSDKIMTNLTKIPEVTVANITSGQFGALCKIRCRDTSHAKNVIYKINDVSGVVRTESMISLEETINDKKRLFKQIFEL